MNTQSVQYAGLGLNGYDVVSASRMQNDVSAVGTFKSMLDSSINGDYRSSFVHTQNNPSDVSSRPQGFAANSASKDAAHVRKSTIDRTSKLYEKAQELESYIVKMMLSSMRETLNTKSLYGESYATQVYEDMMYDELSVSMTKNAGFGLADQVYLELKA